MKHLGRTIRHLQIPPQLLASLGAALLCLLSGPAVGQQLLLSNPHWNITLSDFGYSDYLLDNTPGVEGREYLSGEWGAAVGYQLAGNPPTPPQWLEPHFIFPDWNTASTFDVATPLTQTGVNADGLPIARSILTNSALEITLGYEMVDTVVGTPMGTKPASATGEATFISSDRYVLKQTCTIANRSGSAISNVQLFQLLHGLNSQRGVYDNRLHSGPLSEFRYDVTQAGVDAWATGAGSSSAGLEDLIAFHSSVSPSGYEIGYYGIEGNGVDDHALGKPSEGVHLSVENNWLTPPYAGRLGTDNFAPSQRWVAAVQRWDLGNLAAGQSASLEVLLTLRTGTRVTGGTNQSGGCNGGPSVPGGVEYEFEDVLTEGSCFGEYSQADESEIAVRIAAGEFEPFDFMTPGGPVQLWELEFSGSHSGAIYLTFGYDPAILPVGLAQSNLCVYQFNGTSWQKLASAVNTVIHTIAVSVDNLSVFALGVEGGAAFTINASVAPAGSGTIKGQGTYAEGSAVTLVATANVGYVFTNWTESDIVIATSPSYTFPAHSHRTLVANFAVVGSGRTITTSSLPPSGGSTSGGGEYAAGSSATVVATPNAGYKFSKWLEGGTVISSASSYTFTVSTNRALVAKFKPVYAIVVIPEPPEGGELEADAAYEFGELAKLKAVPNNGYAFVNWTQNGAPVSDDEIYQFNVTANRTLVGHFAPGNRIEVSAEPANGGIAAGGGVYSAGANVSLTAQANPGYVFLNWTENGIMVCDVSTYNLTSNARHTLVAHFIAQPALNGYLALDGTLIVAWPAGASDWVLQESTDLDGGNWIPSTRPFTIVGNQKLVTLSPLPGKNFFRLNYSWSNNPAARQAAAHRRVR